jgi:4-hydroxy-3-methylbut-2-en-1-yl diphosphate synthase IspG/GcpE
LDTLCYNILKWSNLKLRVRRVFACPNFSSTKFDKFLLNNYYEMKE